MNRLDKWTLPNVLLEFFSETSQLPFSGGESPEEQTLGEEEHNQPCESQGRAAGNQKTER